MIARYLAIMIFAILAGCSQKQEERIIDVKPIVLTAEEQQYIETHHIVTWAVEDNRPPGIYVDDKSIIRGRVPAYLALISKKTGLIFRPVPVGSLSEAYDAVRDGHIDLITNVRPTDERYLEFGFTTPFATNVGVFLFRPDSPRSPLVAGIQKGDAAKGYLMSRFPGIKLIETSDHEESIALLQKNLLDVVMINEASADYFTVRYNLKARKVKTDFIYYATFGYKKDNTILGSIMSKAISSISEEDKNTINESWRHEAQ